MCVEKLFFKEIEHAQLFICVYLMFCSGTEGGTCLLAKLLQSCLTLCTPCSVSHQALLSMGFFRQEYWRGLPCLPPGDLPKPGIEPVSLISPALAGRLLSASTTWEAQRSWEDGQMEENVNK